MKRFIISEEEKKQILNQHSNKGLTISENLDEYYFNDDEESETDYSLDQSTGKLVPYEKEEEESGLPENPKYERSLSSKEDDEEIMYEIEMDEQYDEDEPFEKGPRGMRAARTRADFNPTAREIEMTGVFGKHGEDVDPTTIRYMRKNPGAIIKRLADMYGVDKIKSWLDIE
jgi:hypothetical protein